MKKVKGLSFSTWAIETLQRIKAINVKFPFFKSENFMKGTRFRLYRCKILIRNAGNRKSPKNQGFFFFQGKRESPQSFFIFVAEQSNLI